MATPVLMSLTSGLMASGAGELIGAGIKVLAERAKIARENYQQTVVRADEPIEILRHQVIGKISELRNRAALCVSDSELQQKVWYLLMEQTAEAYETNCERHLHLVQDNTAQIEAVLNSYQQAMNYRQRARMIAVVISILSLVGIGLFIWIARSQGMQEHALIPVLGVPWCVLLWSVIGSFAAILYRFTNAGDGELQDPLRWLFSRPLTGIVMGAITFLVLRAGLLTISPDPGSTQAEKLGSNEIMWLIAFLAGFSDRFADALLKSIAGRFGGEKTGDLIAMQMNARQLGSGILDRLTPFEKTEKAPHSAAPAPAVAPSETSAKPKSQALTLIDKPEAAVMPLTN
ncbi:MAG TPA: hypothetical protein VJN43_16155 [Bryobacteraceae bacterium]|nr:hypothetical protein [Bryobacteraceae bacterium]